MAASSHNTQCWKFRLEEQRILILPDWQRRCAAVDPDNHHLFVSLGCAAENLRLAAMAQGFHCDIQYDASASAVVASLKAANVTTSPLSEAIPARQCTRLEYDGKPVASASMKLLELAARGPNADPIVTPIIFTARSDIEKVIEYVVEANTTQMKDAAFNRELKAWIRFNEAEALQTRDGLYSICSGNPAVPRWMGTLFFDLFLRSRTENDSYAKQMRSSAGVIVFVSAKADEAHWVQAGSAYERFALQATALGIRNAFVNQPVEVPAVRGQFASWLGLGDRRPDLVVRFGHGAAAPRSLRRSVDAVLI